MKLLLGRPKHPIVGQLYFKYYHIAGGCKIQLNQITNVLSSTSISWEIQTPTSIILERKK
jgi:hypothetical protein